jgi:hypothetical protein
VGLLEQVAKTARCRWCSTTWVCCTRVERQIAGLNSFREALARDLDYRAVRVNLDRMRRDGVGGGTRVARSGAEQLHDRGEHHAPGKPVEGNQGGRERRRLLPGYHTAGARDGRRQITNRSTTLAPVLKIFEEEGRITNWEKVVQEPGASLQQIIAPPPNATLYMAVSAMAAVPEHTRWSCGR